MTEQNPDPVAARDAGELVSAISAKTAVLAHRIEEGAPVSLEVVSHGRSESVVRRRIRKFRRIKRGYWSFLVITVAYVVSFLLPVLANNVALLVRYDGQYYFPIVRYYPAATFGPIRSCGPGRVHARRGHGWPTVLRPSARRLPAPHAGCWRVSPKPRCPGQNLRNGSPPSLGGPPKTHPLPLTSHH